MQHVVILVVHYFIFSQYARKCRKCSFYLQHGYRYTSTTPKQPKVNDKFMKPVMLKSKKLENNRSISRYKLSGVKMLGARVPAGTRHVSRELNIAS